jgi:Ca2+-transporting ATPase
MDPIADDVLKQSPRNPSESMLGKTQWISIVSVGLIEAAVTLSAFFYSYETSGIYDARNLAFNVLVFSQMFRAFGARSATKLHWQVGAFSNLPLLLVILATIFMQISIHYISVTQTAFQIRPLSALQLTSAILLGLIVVSLVEISKPIRRYLR